MHALRQQVSESENEDKIHWAIKAKLQIKANTFYTKSEYIIGVLVFWANSPPSVGWQAKPDGVVIVGSVDFFSFNLRTGGTKNICNGISGPLECFVLKCFLQ